MTVDSIVKSVENDMELNGIKLNDANDERKGQ